jgi:hypothetical protein
MLFPFIISNFPIKNISYIVQKRKTYGTLKFQDLPFVNPLFKDSKAVISLKDLYQSANSKSLLSLIETLGIDTKYKDCQLDKSKMENSFENEEDLTTFLHYSLNDVVILEKSLLALTELINGIYEKIKIPLVYEPSDLPNSTGRLVWDMIVKYIETSFFNECGTKKGQLFLDLNKKFSVKENYSKKDGGKRISSLIGGASVKSIAHLYRGTSGVLNALVQGGRCYNERPFEYLLEHTLDLDFKSCYGSSLRDFNIPIGLPYVVAYSSQQKNMTLRQFLKTYEDDLVPNFYTITISGQLNFHQSLLYSKITSAALIQKRINQIRNEEDMSLSENFTGDFVILEKELHNTILTSDILNIVRKICTNSELNEIMNCEVETAIFYSKRLRSKDLTHFIDQLSDEKNLGSKSKDNYRFEFDSQSCQDHRPRTWVSLPYEKFIGPLIQLRKELQNNVKAGVDVKKNSSLEKLVKLIVNTTYGVSSSPFYEGNTVVANNITARARADIWLASRAVNGIQSVTDGCQFQPDNLFKIKNLKSLQKPGLNALSNLEFLKNHKYIEKTSLGVEKIFENETLTFQELEGMNVDSLAEQHINNFWANYGLKINYSIELKIVNTGKVVFYIKKAHYAILTVFNQIVLKFRGVGDELIQENQGEKNEKDKNQNQRDENENENKNENKNKKQNKVFDPFDQSNMEDLNDDPEQMEDILELENSPSSPPYHIISRNLLLKENKIITNIDFPARRLSTCHDYLQSSISKNKGKVQDLIRPGYNLNSNKTFRLTNMDLPYTNLKEFKSRKLVDYGTFFLNQPPNSYDRILQQRISDYKDSKNSEVKNSDSKTKKNKKKE